MKKTKKELLKHYKGGDVHKFLQLDGRYDPGIYDCFMKPDGDGDVLTLCETEELRRSPKELAVRVLIHDGTKRTDAIRLLKKLINILECEPFDVIDCEKIWGDGEIPF